MMKNEGVKISEEDESDVRMLMDDVTPEDKLRMVKIPHSMFFGWSRRNTTPSRTSVRCVAPPCN